MRPKKIHSIQKKSRNKNKGTNLDDKNETVLEIITDTNVLAI